MVLSTEVEVKHVSCLLTFIVLISLKVVLFLDERLFGGDGGGSTLTEDGAARLKLAKVLLDCTVAG